jgi:PAS domain S-box-containing protein
VSYLTTMVYIPNYSYTQSRDMLPILDILENSDLCFSIKNSNLEYLYVNNRFSNLFGLSKNITTDFEVFVPEIAYELNQEDSLVLTTTQPDEQDRILIGKNGKEMVANISRYVSEQNGEIVLVSIIKDITKKSQAKQFDDYKKIFSDTDVFEKMLNRFSNLIFSTNEKNEIFEGVGNLCLELLDLEDISIFMADHKNQILKQTLIVERGKGVRYDTVGDSFITIPLNKGITGRCAKTMQSILVDDVTLDPDYVADTISCRSELAVPIVYKNKLLGVIDSESTSLGRYTEHIRRTLEGIAALLAIKLNELNNYIGLTNKNSELLSLIKHNPAAIAMLDSDFNYIELSDRWLEQFYKGTTKQLRGKNHFTLNPNIPLRWKKRIRDAAAGQIVNVPKESYRRKNGDILFISARIHPWFTVNNNIGGVIIMSEDITEQENNLLKLAHTNEILKNSNKFDKLYNWIVNFDNGYFKWIDNKVVIPEFPSEKEHDLDSVFALIDEVYHADFQKSVQDAIKSGKSFDFIHPFNLGQKRFWLQNRGTVHSKNGQVTKIIGHAKDITDQIDAEIAIKTRNSELKKVNQELDQFVYKTAHDLRAPLTNLLGLIEIMKAEEDKELLNSYFDLQQKSIEKLDTFIQKITASTKNSRLPIVANEVNFANLVDEVLSDHCFYENSDKVTKQLTIDNKATFYSDYERVKIIVSNLVSNAIHFCDLEKNAELGIEVSLEGELIRIKVRDNGVGIAANLQDRVFEMFYRAHKRAVGAGIGLYIVKETINKLNGSIHLLSEEGKFTEINVFLPNRLPNQ